MNLKKAIMHNPAVNAYNEKLARYGFGLLHNQGSKYIKHSMLHLLKGKKSSNPKVKELEMNGFVKFERTQKRIELCQRINEIYQSLIDVPGEAVDRGYGQALPEFQGKLFSKSIVNLNKLNPYLMELVDEEIISVMEGYTRNSIQFDSIAGWRNYPVPEKLKNSDVYANVWHQDSSMNFLDIKLFIVINDIDLTQGPFEFLSIPDSKRSLRSRYVDRYDYNGVDFEEFHPNKLVGKAGDLLLINTCKCMHRAGNVEEGKTRDIIQYIFRPSDKPFQKNILQDLDARNYSNPGRKI